MTPSYNKDLGKIYIRKRTTQEWLVFLLFWLPFMFAFSTEILGLPDFLRFVQDGIIIFLCFVLALKGQFSLHTKAKPLLIFIAIFFTYALITYLINYQSPFYFIWGVRNNFRFYLSFLIFIMYVTPDDAFSWLKILDTLYWVNFFVSLIQFFFLDVRQDYLGGIFGSVGRTNAYTLIFFCIVISKSLLSAFNGTEKTFYCILKCIASLVIAAMAEMKLYYFIFIFIFIVSSLFTKFSIKKVVLLIVGVAGVLLSSVLLTMLFGFEDFLSFDNLWEYATKANYSSANDLNRFSAIATLSKEFMHNPISTLFGLGLGNCDLSDLAIFNTPFYQNYGYLHYTWFTAPMVFIEMGTVGLILYFFFFIFCLIYSIVQLKKGRGYQLFNQLAIVLAPICIIISFYNSSLRIESAYMLYFMLSLPFLVHEEDISAKSD